MTGWRALLGAAVLPTGAFAESLAPAPDAYVELVWSSSFAATLVMDCDDYVFEETDHPNIMSHLQSLHESGIDLANAQTVYANVPEFNREIARQLIESSSLSEVIMREDADICDLASLIDESEMVTGLFIRRKTILEGNS